MDPDKALARVIELAELIVNHASEDLDWSAPARRAEELSETVLGLDEWLRNGGFLPTAWKRSASTGAEEGS